MGRVDRWFGLELLRLDCYMCDLYFLTGIGAARRTGVQPLHPCLLGTSWRLYQVLVHACAPPPSWHISPFLHPCHSG